MAIPSSALRQAADTYLDVQHSFARCLARVNFLKRFYALFMSSHTDIAAMFARTDLERQHLLLRRALGAVIAYAGGSEAARAVIDRIGQSHGRHGFNIQPWMYDYWTDSLMQAVAEHDPQFSIQLERRWRRALSMATDHIKDAY